MSENDPYEAQTRTVLNRKAREMERAKDELDATKKMIKNMYRELLDDRDIRSAVSQEMIAGVKGQSQVSQVLEKLMGRQKTSDGLNAKDIENFGNEYNCPTGNEDRYWDKE